MNWLLFLSQLPTNPSSLRVTVWRKMRAAGALGIQNGVWMLPDEPERTRFLEELLSSIQYQGANGQIFKVSPLSEKIEQDILERFRAERDEEYAEFCERGQAFLEEIAKETQNGKFIFAELEEIEQDYQRLESWLEKIRKRDFIGGRRAEEANQLYQQCQAAFQTFSTAVFACQGIDVPQNPEQENE